MLLWRRTQRRAGVVAFHADSTVFPAFDPNWCANGCPGTFLSLRQAALPACVDVSGPEHPSVPCLNLAAAVRDAALEHAVRRGFSGLARTAPRCCVQQTRCSQHPGGASEIPQLSHSPLRLWMGRVLCECGLTPALEQQFRTLDLEGVLCSIVGPVPDDLLQSAIADVAPCRVAADDVRGLQRWVAME